MDILRDYLAELVSDYFSIALLLFGLLGIVLLFWPGFRWAQLTGLFILILSFGVTNYRIYSRQRKLLRSYDEQRAKRLSVSLALLDEIQANTALAERGEFFLREFSSQSSDNVWQQARHEFYWLPTELQGQLLAYYRTLRSLVITIEDAIKDGRLEKAIGLCSILAFAPLEMRRKIGKIRAPERGLLKSWFEDMWHRVEQFVQSSEELSEPLRKHIGQLKVAEGCDTR